MPKSAGRREVLNQLTDCYCTGGRVLTRLVRAAPRPLLIALALCLVWALGAFPATPAHAQDGKPVITIRTDVTEVPEGRPVDFTLTRTGGDISSPLTVRAESREPNHPDATFGGNPSHFYQYVTFEAGSATATMRARTSLDQVDDAGNDWLEAGIAPGTDSPYIAGNPKSVKVTITAPNENDVLVIIAAAQTSVAEGGAASYTLTRTGDITSALTVDLEVEDPGDLMRGDPWEDDPVLPTQAVFEANRSTATLTLNTRQNRRDKPNPPLEVSLKDGSGYLFSLPSRASVAVVDDDTPPEVSLSVDKTEVVEGEHLTFTVTRHGDTTEAFDLVYLRIGPDPERLEYRRILSFNTPRYHKINIPPGAASAQKTVWVPDNRSIGDEDDFRYQATIAVPPWAPWADWIPEGDESQYFSVRGPRTVSAAVTELAYQGITITYDESERWHEGQEVALTLHRQGTGISEELEVRLFYVEVRHPDRVRPGDDRPGESFRGNPSVRHLYYTFPAGSDTLDFSLTIGADDVVEWWEEDWILIEVRPVRGVDRYRPMFHDPGTQYGIDHQIFDNPRTVSIAADSPTIDEGQAANFTVTRGGPTEEALTLRLSVEDPGDFMRGDHGQSAPGIPAVSFEAGFDTATLSLPTRDDRRDIPDNALTVTVLPSQDGSYRVIEGSGSAAVTVRDNDVALQLELSADRTEIVEGETVIFRVRRIGDARNHVDWYVLVGLQGRQTLEVYGLSPGEMALTREIRTEDDDFDGADLVYEATLAPYESVPEEERAQYWTVLGPGSVTVTVADNDLPLVGVEAMRESYIEPSRGEFRLVREGQTTGELRVKARVTETGNAYFDRYRYLLGRENTYTIPASSDSLVRGFQLQPDDGDEDEGAMTMQLLPGDGYRIDPARSVASFRVIDTDPEPVLSVANASAPEGGGSVDFQVSLSSTVSPPSRRTVTVDYATSDGTATAGEDYAAGSGTLTIGPQQTGAVISVPILDDRLAERSQTFTLTLSNPSFAELQDQETAITAVGTIEDNEPRVSIRAHREAVTEGEPAVFEFTRTGDAAEELTVSFNIFELGVRSSEVFGHSASFLPGSSSVRWSRETEDNERDQPAYTVAAVMSDRAASGDPSAYFVGAHTAQVIVNDDDLPTVSIAPAYDGREEGQNAEFTLTREGDLSVTLTVNVSVTEEGAFMLRRCPVHGDLCGGRFDGRPDGADGKRHDDGEPRRHRRRHRRRGRVRDWRPRQRDRGDGRQRPRSHRIPGHRVPKPLGGRGGRRRLHPDQDRQHRYRPHGARPVDGRRMGAIGAGTTAQENREGA